MSTETENREDDAALAGEYVLGLLDPAETRAFEMRLGGEPALRQAVADWTEGLVTLTDGIAPVTPPEAIKARLDAQLFPARPAARRSGFSLRRLIFGGVTGLVAALALVVVLPFVTPQAPGAAYQAEIVAQDASLIVLARLEVETRTLTLSRSVGQPAAGRSLELWLIPGGATVPVSLGVIDPAEARVTVPEVLIGGFESGTLAISDEPLGGSPTGVATTVVAAGPVIKT